MSKRKRDGTLSPPSGPQNADIGAYPVSAAGSTRLITDPVQSTPATAEQHHSSEPDTTPAGPYSYVVERRAAEAEAGETQHGQYARGQHGHKRARSSHFQPGSHDSHDHSKIGARRSGHGGSKPRVNARWGQMGAFPEPACGPTGIERPKSNGDAGAGSGSSVGDMDVLEEGEVDGTAEQEEHDRAAWAYLRSVREEAERLPPFLSARDTVSKHGSRTVDGTAEGDEMDEGEVDDLAAGDEEDEGEDAGEWHAHEIEEYDYPDDDEDDAADQRAFYSDGAWIAAPLRTGSRTDPPLPAAQRAYHAALLVRFQHHRAQLQDLKHRFNPTHSDSGLDFAGSMRHHRPSFVNMRLPALSLTSANITTNGTSSSTTNSTGASSSGSSSVKPRATAAQILALPRSALLHALAVIDTDLEHHLSRGTDVPAHICTWTWTLLGLLDGPGVLGSEEVSVVRDLGKRCAWGLLRLRAAAESAEAQMEEDGGLGGKEMDEGLREGKAQTRALLEGVLHLVSEVWGQRDLLEGHVAWVTAAPI